MEKKPENCSNKRILKGSLGDYKYIETDDGSLTLFSEYFGEACHSQAGAVIETLYNYVDGTQVVKRLLKGPLSVFEVGFATGLGLETTLLNLGENSHELLFVSSELDELLTEVSLAHLQDKGLINPFETFMVNSLTYKKATFNNHKGGLVVLIGDVRDTLPLWMKCPEYRPFQSIYQDPFSPKRNPRLWTKEWFSLLKEASAIDVILGTYSSTKAVWKAMMVAGWKVQDVPGYGNKKLSTRGYLSGESSERIIDWCQRSPAPALSDSGTS